MTREEFIDIVYDQVRDESADKIINAMDELLKQQIANEPIRCGECENYIDSRCIEANHHVAAHGNCMGVFGAKRREL